jgi:hypothetical protein
MVVENGITRQTPIPIDSVPFYLYIIDACSTPDTLVQITLLLFRFAARPGLPDLLFIAGNQPTDDLLQLNTT